MSESTGSLVWSYTTGNGVFSSPAVADGVVFVGSWDGKVYAFGTPTQESEFTLELTARWNMVSLPVVPDDSTASAVMPSGVFYQLMTWTGTGYVSSTEFEAGRGYWLLVLQDVDVTVSGEPVDSLILGLSAGWNMVGGPLMRCKLMTCSLVSTSW